MIMMPKVGDIIAMRETIRYADTYRIVELCPNKYNPTYCFAVCVSAIRPHGRRVFYENPKKTYKLELDSVYYVTDASYLEELNNLVSKYNKSLVSRVKIVCE